MGPEITTIVRCVLAIPSLAFPIIAGWLVKTSNDE
jgi:hypothetical protein